MKRRPAIKTFSTVIKSEPSRPAICPLCGNAPRGRVWNADGVSFRRCMCSGLFMQDPQALRVSVLARYDGSYLDYERARQFDFRDLELRSLADIDFNARRGLKLLDVGCATGALLAALRDSGCIVRGVELCRESAEYGIAKFGLDIHIGTLETAPFPDASFDCVHASHVIEHLNDPRAFLAKAHRLLSPGGTLILTTPNTASFQAALMKASWRSAINDHLFLFSRKNLEALLNTEGFIVEKTRTWGGWPSGMEPGFLKRPFDSAAKALGIGDVMIIQARSTKLPTNA